MSAPNLAGKRKATQARAVGSRARGYAEEWARELRRRGVMPNGDYNQQRTGRAAQEYKSPVRRKPTTLAQLARAWDEALASGTGRYAPVPELDTFGYDYRAAARARLPKR